MIKSFKPKGLELFFATGNIADIQAKHKNKLRLQLAALDTALVIDDLDLPEYRLHKLKDNRQHFWSITVNTNWRLSFQFIKGDIHIINYEDYH
jgi:proteic killer suppression protein